MEEGDEIKDYKVLSVMHTSTQGKVYLIENKSKEKLVLKSWHLEQSKRNKFEEIFSGWKMLAYSCENIVRFDDFFYDSNIAYVVMEFCSGGDLESLITQKKEENSTFTEFEVQKIGADVFAGIKEMHKLNMIHRNLKPSKILIAGDGTYKLASFNMSQALNDTDDFITTIAGTLQYISPEIFQHQKFTPAADMYAIGAILYELLMLKPAFPGPDVENILANRYDPIEGAECTVELTELVQRLMSQDPSARPSLQVVFSDPVMAKSVAWREAAEHRRGAIRAALAPLKDIHVLLIGKTQIGKSTLINRLLGDVRAKMGDGVCPITGDFTPYRHHALPLVLWDSRGLEVEGSKEQKGHIQEFMFKKEQEFGPTAFPLMLLCVSEEEPVEEIHRFLYECFCDRMAVLLVMTKAKHINVKAKRMEEVKKSFPGVLGIYRVNSIEEEKEPGYPEEGVYEVRGLAELAMAMARLLPHGIEKRRMWNENCGRLKDQALQEVSNNAWKTAAAVTAIPAPFIDQLPVKFAMRNIMTTTGKIFGKEFSKDFQDTVLQEKRVGVGKWCTFFKCLPFWDVRLMGAAIQYRSVKNSLLCFGRNFVRAVFVVRAREKKITEDAVLNELNKAY